MAEAFRTCPTTGLKVHLPAENLIKANAVAAVVFLAVGGLFGLLVALTRSPAVHLLPADWFYLALTAHGLDVLLVWIIFFEMAILYFASAVLLNCRLATPRIAWAGFALMLAGAVIVNVTALQGQSTVMFTSYVPMKAATHFYLGLLLFAVGALTQPRLHELPGYPRHRCRGRPRVGRAHHPCAMVRGGIMRSFHRYASDALVLVAMLHLLREYLLDRMRGARWLAWFTGVPLLWLCCSRRV